MQSLTWYVQRLCAMSSDEIAWRIRSGVRDTTDRYRLALTEWPPVPGGSAASAQPGFRVTELPVGAWRDAAPGSPEAAWRDALRTRADRIAAHTLSFFSLEERHLGDPIDWNRDHESGRKAPGLFSALIDYRDFAVTGDCKLVWEPNRHHHVVVLARAYRATGDERYAGAVVEQLTSWLDQNPFGYGMNWRSPLELGIRLINWVWAIDLIRDSGQIDAKTSERLWRAAYLHQWDVVRKYSRGSSANNHRVGEAAGVFIAASYFDNMPGAAAWRDEAFTMLCEEIEAQSYQDGCTREQAFGYQMFVMQFYLAAALVGRKTGREFPAAYWNRLEQMLGFAADVTAAAETTSFFGDADDGYVLDLGASGRDLRDLLSSGAVLFQSPKLKAGAREYREATAWLLGPQTRADFDRLTADAAVLAPIAFDESGYYLLQTGDAGDKESLSVLFDCGELGFGDLAAHGHADALSVTLRAFGREVLVDPGTYDYFTHPAWRAYFRSTAAHNTVVVDDEDQSVMAGLFLWKRRAVARCAGWDADDRTVRAIGEHDGYQRLADPVGHRRSVTLCRQTRAVVIQDDLSAQSTHRAAVYFHVAEQCVVRPRGSHAFEIDTGAGRLLLELDVKLSVTNARGSENPIAGWVSRRYHQRTPTVTLIGRAAWDGVASYVHRITVCPD